MKSTKELCAYGQEKGVAIILETFDRAVDKKALDWAESAGGRVRSIGSASCPEFGLMYDLSHQPLLGEGFEEALGLLKDYLVHIHVGNCVVTPGAPRVRGPAPPFRLAGGKQRRA